MSEPEREIRDRDDLARRAAMVLLRSPGLAVETALRKAQRGRGASCPGGPPGRGLVYRHLEAMLQEALGQEAFEASRQQRMHLIVEVLDLLDYLAGPDAIDLAGRTARGYLEGPVLVFARLYEGAALEPLAAELEANGIEEVVCATAQTRHGPLPRLLFESDGVRFIITRCPRSVHAERDRSLFSGETIAVKSLDAFRSAAGS